MNIQTENHFIKSMIDEMENINNLYVVWLMHTHYLHRTKNNEEKTTIIWLKIGN